MKTLLKIFAAAIIAVILSMYCFFSLAETIAAVGRGMAASAGIMDASWIDRGVASAFHIGGWRLAEMMRAAVVFVPSFAFLCVLFWIGTRLRSRLGFWGSWIPWVISVLLFSYGIWKSWNACKEEIRDIRLLAPVALLDAAQRSQGRVFYNPSATWSIAAFVPELLDKSLSQHRRLELIQSAALWHKEDRLNPWSAVVISSQVSEARSLIEHLLASPDWRLAFVDNQGLLFLRGTGQSFSPVPYENAAQDFLSSEERALFLAQSALTLEAAGLKVDARAYVDEALKIAPENFEVLVRAASLAGSHGRWPRARSLAERALAIKPSSPQAAYLYAFSLLETGVKDKAFEETDRLVRFHPQDSKILLLHARAARAVNDYSAEIGSLEKLLALEKQGGGSPARIHIYLGQAWAAKAFARQALEHYHAALQGPLTSNEERDVREAIEIIESKRLPERSN